MNTASSKLARLLNLLLIGSLCVSVASCKTFGGQEDDGDGTEQKKVRVSYTVNKRAWKHLSAAQTALGEKDYKTAQEELDDMKYKAKRFNPYELAMMWQTYAHLYAAQEKLVEATDALAKSLEGDTLPEGTLVDVLFNLGSLQAATEQYPKASDTFTRWLEIAHEKATPQARYNIAAVYAQAKHWDKSLEQTELIIREAADPPEEWLRLLLSIHFEMGRIDKVEATLKRLLVRYPSTSYWQQLAGIYSGDKRNERALAVWEIMELQDMFKSKDELIRLAQTLTFRGVPTKAMKVLKRGLNKSYLRRDAKTLEVLATAYVFARESDQAKTVLAEAARKSGDGELFLELGRQHLRDGEWDLAAAAIAQGIRKGGIPSVGEAYLLLGSTHYNAERWKDAQAAFSQAATFPASRATAERWQAATRAQVQAANALARNP